MKVPDKIYLQQYDTDTVVFLNKYNIDEEWTEVPINDRAAKDIEYIRKDALMEWAKGEIMPGNSAEGKGWNWALQTLIDKIESL